MLLLVISLWSNTYITGNPVITKDIEQGFILPSLLYKYNDCFFLETGAIENYGIKLGIPKELGFIGVRFTKGIYYNWDVSDPFFEIVYGYQFFGLGLNYANFRNEEQNSILERKTYGGTISFNIMDFAIALKVYKYFYNDQRVWGIERSKNSYSYDANIIYSRDFITPFFHYSHNDLSFEEANVVDTSFTESKIDSMILGVGLNLSVNDFVNFILIPNINIYSEKEDENSLTRRSLYINGGFDIRFKFIKFLFGMNGSLNQNLVKQDTTTFTDYSQNINYRTGIFFLVKDFDFGFVLNNNFFSQGPYFITGIPLDPVVEFGITWRFKD